MFNYLHLESHRQKRSEPTSERRIALYKTSQQQGLFSSCVFEHIIMHMALLQVVSVVLRKSSLLPHGCSCSVAPWGQCCHLVSLQGVCVGGGGGGRGQNCRTCPGDCGPVWSLCKGGRTVEHALGTVVLSSDGVVNSLDFCPASLKSLGCFYFRCVLSSQW